MKTSEMQTYSDAMHAYVNDLLSLHHFFLEGKNDTDEADEVRERMDGPWSEMSSAELNLAENLSGDLYSISEVHPQSANSMSSENASYLGKFLEGKEWAAALTFLREIETPDNFYDIASMRSFIWFEMGFPEVAYEFIAALSEINNLGVSRELLFLKVCELTKNYDTGMKRALRYDEKSHPMLWFASFRLVTFKALSEENPDRKNQLLGFANAIGLRCISLFDKNIADPEFTVTAEDARQISTYTHEQIAINLAQLGLLDSAKSHLQTVLAIDPVNLSAFDLLKEIDIKEKSIHAVSSTRAFTNYGSRLPIFDIRTNLLIPAAVPLN
jgi:hypothetical protein